MTDELYRSEQPAPILSINASVGGQNALVDQIISLNAKHAPFFGVGDIWLSEKAFWATVSPDMPSDYYDSILAGLKSGAIVKGKRWIPAVDRSPKTLEEWYKAVDVEGGRSPKTVAAFKTLIAKRKDGNYSLGEIVRYCMAQERKGKNREEVLEFLREVYMYVDARDRSLHYDDEIVEDQEGKIEVTLVQTPEGVRILGDPSDPVGRQPDQMSEGRASKVLDEAFGLDE